MDINLAIRRAIVTTNLRERERRADERMTRKIREDLLERAVKNAVIKSLMAERAGKQRVKEALHRACDNCAAI